MSTAYKNLVDRLGAEGASAEMRRRALLVKNRYTQGNTEWAKNAAKIRWQKYHENKKANASKKKSLESL